MIIKVIKYFITSLISFLLISAIGIAAIIFFDARSLVTVAVNSSSNYELQLDEPIEIAFYPVLKVHAKKISLADTTFDTSIDFLFIDNFSFSVNLKEYVTQSRFITDITIQKIDIQSKLRADGRTNLDDLLNTSFNITGHIFGDVTLTGNGLNFDMLQKNWNGHIDLEVQEGRWFGGDIWQELRSARSIYKREDHPVMTQLEDINLFSLKASGPIEKSVFSNQNFTMNMPYTSIVGNGEWNIADNAFDYSIRVSLMPEIASELNMSDDEIQDFTNGSIPIRVQGSSDSISFRPDIEAIFRDEVEITLEDQGDKLKKSIMRNLFK